MAPETRFLLCLEHSSLLLTTVWLTSAPPHITSLIFNSLYTTCMGMILFVQDTVNTGQKHLHTVSANRFAGDFVTANLSVPNSLLARSYLISSCRMPCFLHPFSSQSASLDLSLSSELASLRLYFHCFLVPHGNTRFLLYLVVSCYHGFERLFFFFNNFPPPNHEQSSQSTLTVSGLPKDAILLNICFHPALLTLTLASTIFACLCRSMLDTNLGQTALIST